MKILKDLLEIAKDGEPRRQKQKRTQSNRPSQTQERPTEDLNDLFRNFIDNAHKNDIELSQKQQQQVKQTLNSKKLSQAETAELLSNMSSPSPEVATRATVHLMSLANIDVKDIISDEQAQALANLTGGDDATDTTGATERPVTTDPDTLPAVINTQLKAEGIQEVKFMQVKHLPGYLRNPIRAMGRQVFAVFTKTKIEDISIIANLESMGGPNEMAELNAVAGFAKKYGQKDTHAELNFEQSIPGYDAEVAVYTAEGVTYMMVKDFMGSYIYSWPATDNKKISSGKGSKRLTNESYNVSIKEALHRLAKDLNLKVKTGQNEIENIVMEDKKIEDVVNQAMQDAETIVFDNAAVERTSVNGSDIIRHAVNRIKKLKLDPDSEKVAIRQAYKKVDEEYGKLGK